jgi:hypothetical protein
VFELRFEKMKYDKNIYKVLFTLVILCFTVAGQAQLTVHSIDLNTPMYYSANWTNPLGIGITVNTKSQKYKLFGRVAGFSEGGFQTILFQDTAHGGSYTYDDKLVYKLPDGDSVLTKSFHSYNKGLGIQLGLRSDFKIFSVPFYTSAHIGLFAHKRDHARAQYYTVNKPDTTTFSSGDGTSGSYFISDYTKGYVTQILEDVGWSLLPQLGLETGIILSAGNRLEFTPKVALNLSSYRHSDINDVFFQPTGANATPRIRTWDISMSATLQVSYLIHKKE